MAESNVPARLVEIESMLDRSRRRFEEGTKLVEEAHKILAEVQQAIMQHPAVQDCAVIGLPDEKWGERVTAVVQLRAGRTAEPQEIGAFVRERIGGVKTPKQIEIWPDLPRSKVGKVLKRDIKATLTDA